MLTQAMPAVVRALQGTMPSAALKQLTQALGNCNQEVSQRGDVNVSPDAWTNANNNNGVYEGDTWNQNDYRNLITNGDLINNINNQNAFDFSTRQEFATNNFYGGDIQNYAGDVNISNLNTDNITTINLTVTGGEKGDPGEPGPPGQPGADGMDGQIIVVQGRPFNQMPIRYLSGANPRIVITPKKSFRTVVVGTTFDAETCEVRDTTVDLEILDSVEAEIVGLIPQNLVVLTP